GKTAIVTGAAHGIGRAIARHFLDRGANVMCADIDEDTLHDDIGADAATDGPLRVFGGDLRERLTVTNLIAATIDAFDRVDILVNAARAIATSDPLGVGDDAMEEMLQHNLLTSLRLSQQVARRMIAQAGREGEAGNGAPAAPAGAIVNISSIAARRTQPELLAYSISCAALDQMTRSMAVALAPRRIRVNAIAFGSVMSASLQARLKDKGDLRAEILGNTPMGRIAAPVELAEAVQFLASDAAGFLTGQVVTVDGGRTLIDPACAPVH
ncbi:MAG: SDR family NAD(P)-dependent oxidoreductase, partial [Gemmobacter sp.]